MSCSKLFVRDDPHKFHEKKDNRNHKKREKFTALSAEEKEACRIKNREAYHRKKLEKMLSKSLPEQFQEACKSPASTSVMRALAAQQYHVSRVTDSQNFKHKEKVDQIIDCNQGHCRGPVKCGVQISESPNNSAELSDTHSSKKSKQQTSSFSMYEKGSTSNSKTKHIYVPSFYT